MRRIGASALLILSALLTTSALAQNATTSLRGIIKDPTGAVISGAVITLQNKAAGQTLTARSKADGIYQFVEIPPAKYIITVEAEGFGVQSKLAELLVNLPATVNFVETVAGSAEVVDVTESTQTLNSVDASLGGAFNNATIQALPSETRNVPDLLSLQPGVLYLPNADQASDSRSGSVNGGRSDQGNITVDGIDDNDQVNGYAFTGVLRETQDAVEEFRVTTGNGNADEGRSSGAQVSLVTKSGTNKFHGAAYEYNRPSNTVSNDFFNKQGQINQGFANRPPKLIRNLFGGDVGGPIIKGKLFFFANYEGLRKAESAVVVGTTPFASYKAGQLEYIGDVPGTGTGTNVPSVVDPTPQVLSAAQFSSLDSNYCTSCNTPVYPANPGANPYVTGPGGYFSRLPTANGFTEGDTLNTGSYTFASPNPVTQNTTIVRLDYIPSSNHRIFARGNLQKDTIAGAEQFPGQPPSETTIDNTKGMTFGDTWTISKNLVNDVRYGYIRQGYGEHGLGNRDYVDFRFLSSPTAETSSTTASVPVTNLIDNLSISKGKHDIEVGFNWRLVHQNRHSNALSYNNASTNAYWTDGYYPDPGPPSQGGYGVAPESVDNGFSNSFLIAYENLVGGVPQVTTQNNYLLTSAGSGTLLGDGAYLDRHFKANEYEGYIQDAWRAIPNLTITAGLRYSLLQTPWETHGQEVAPTINTDAWYKQREASAQQGLVYEPNLTFAPAGHYYGKPGLYAKAKDNVAPRFAINYAPNNKTTVRAGAGLYFDHFGEGLINIYDQSGAFGLSNSVQSPASAYDVGSAPRYTGQTLPFTNGAVSNPITFPYTPANIAGVTDFSIAYGIDNKIKTPYTEAFDVSFQRILPGSFTLEANYVGRMGRHLLQSLDIAQPVDFVDPQGAGDYYTAAARLSQITDQNNGNGGFSNGANLVNVAAIPYFEHVFPFAKNFDYNGESATQAIYNHDWAPNRSSLGETETLADLEIYCGYGCPAGYVSKFWQRQFASLYALSSVGMSYYNALQISVHHPTSHGLQFDFNYSYSKSQDWGSDAERFGANGGSSSIISTWKPFLNKAVSDFDTKHLITVNFVDQLPIGKGKALLGTAGPITNAIIGGWQLSGIFRMASGLPFSVFEPGYTTDWDDPAYGVVTGKVTSKRSFDSNFEPQYFSNAAQINNGISSGSPIRLPYPGEAGQRNNFRGDGYINLDSGLTKSWTLSSYRLIKFSWEVYNVTNTVRFDPLSIDTTLTQSGSFGIASSELSAPRRMQFALRYEF